MRQYRIIVIAVLILLATSCKQRENSHFVELKEPLKSIDDSFTIEYPDRYIYEIFIDKIDPDYSHIFLHAGNLPVTNKENEAYSQRPQSYTLSNNKKLFIYNGSERYINSTLEVDFEQTSLIGDSKFWVIKDSMNTTTIIKEYFSVYPFISLPIQLEESFFKELNALIEEDEKDSIEEVLE